MNAQLAFARQLDDQDPLSPFKEQFDLEENCIYLDGNSLGPLPNKSKEVLRKTIENQWGKRLIRSWNEDWLDTQERTASKIAQLINADPSEVIVCDSVSVNLYKLAFAVLKAQTIKSEIISDSFNFPSDLYIFQSLINDSFSSKKLKIIDQSDYALADKKIINAINENTALVSLSHVAYKSSFKYDVEAIGEVAKKNNAFTLWDFSHSIGAVNIDVKKMGIDMAVGCTYKFLNGGPGAPAFLYIKKELTPSLQNPISGWFSHQKPFEFDQHFESNQSAKGFLVGTPPILSLKGIETGVDFFIKNDPNLIWAKSKSLFDYFIKIYTIELKGLGFEIGTPINFKQRGSHIALLHVEAFRINLSLINPESENKKVFITDHRPPNIIRIAITPLYQSYMDLYELVFRLKSIVEKKEYLNHSAVKKGVI